MGVATQFRSKPLSRRSLSAAASTAVEPWIRPKDWLPLPDVTGQQRLVGLVRIDNTESNYLAVTCAGAYTVDWGDGTVTNHATGTTAQRQYTYSAIPATGETALGYRQVIVQVYPQSGQNLTSVNLAVKHTYLGGGSPATPWLDITLNAPSMTSLTISSTSVAARLLERFHLLSHALQNCSALFRNCSRLRSVPLFNTASVTTFTSMFEQCQALTEVPLFNTAAGTNFQSMFIGCRALWTVPLFNTAAATNMFGMFQACTALQRVPAFNTSNVTNFGYAFFDCRSLRQMPALDYSKATTVANCFQQCSALQALPPMALTAATAANSLFQDCAALTAFEATGGNLVTNWGSAFTGCFSLGTVKGFSAAGATAAGSQPGVASLSSAHTYLVTGVNVTISFASNRFSAAALNTIFTNLSGTGGGKTVTVTSNPGSATCNPAIATAKGWTVAT